MDGASILFITLPLLFPIVTGLGYDPVWFGVCVNILIGVGFITPPVGLNAFVVKGLLPEVELTQIFRGAWPFVITGVISIYVLLIFPIIATFLPSLM
jgi:TRAP-type C4-dicarboxylate transport system permease large subunit